MYLIADQRAHQIKVLDVFSMHSEDPVADYLGIRVWWEVQLPSNHLAPINAAEINLQLTNPTPQQQCDAHHFRLEHHTRQAPASTVPVISSHGHSIKL